MAGFDYKALSLEPHTFRLLRLLKDNNDLIQCELSVSKLPPEDGRVYAALSYTWGGQAKPCEIVINGMKVEVTKNAYLALWDLRHREEDWIWIDALCIDQNNTEEQGEQVQQMGSIYSNAERVIIWLGEATYETNQIMAYMRRLEKEDSSQWENSWLAVENTLTRDRKSLLIEGLKSLFRREWFERVWIIQEVANARNAEIVCGSSSVSASIFSHMPFLLKVKPEPRCQVVLDILPGSIKSRSWLSSTKPDLFTMLKKFRESKATDPRDNIYALLGISSDTWTTKFSIDYTKDLQAVIFNTVSFILGFDNLDPPPRRFFDWMLIDFFNYMDTLTDTILEYAIRSESIAVVKRLIVRDDVDMDMKYDSGQTPLSWAAEGGHDAVVKLLLDRNADIEAKDNSGRTPLSLAAGEGYDVVVKLLLESIADIEARDNDLGQTPLSWAAEGGHDAVVKLLLEGKADIETKDNLSRTPLSLAASGGHDGVVKLLLGRNAGIEAKDDDGRTPLSLAAGGGHDAVVKLLLERKADIEKEEGRY